MLEWVAEANAMLNHVVWGPAGLTLLLGTGLWLTVRMGGLQFRRAGYCLRHTAGEAFCSRRTPRQDQGAITQFQSMCTALAGTVGTAISWGWPQPSSAAGRGRCSGCGSWLCWA